MQSIYSATSGLSAQQTRIDTIAANIANVNTPGYKSTRIDFKDALYHNMTDPVLLNSAANNLLTGSGVVVDATDIDMEQGTVAETGQPTDFAIEGNAYFQVQSQNGEILYTRSGGFSTTPLGSDNYLVTSEGYFALDSTGNRIKIPGSSSNLKVSANGVISSSGQNYGTLGIMSFTNPDGLSPAGDSCYRATAASGQPAQDPTSTVVQGSLEHSNVDLGQELTLLIRAQRAYSLASRALSTSDEMAGLADTMHS